MTHRDDSLSLCDMLDAALQILGYLEGRTREALDDEPMVRDAVIRQFEILGEAARHVSAATRGKHAEIPWGEIVATRNALIHAYRRVDTDIVWRTVGEDLPMLVEQLEAAIKG